MVSGEKWYSWITQYISAVRFLVLVNGFPLAFLIAHLDYDRGICCLPLLFVIIMKVLSRMITAASLGLLGEDVD